jgi:hypothetical protein
VLIPRNNLGREKDFAIDTTCFLLFEDLPSKIPIGISSVSGQNEYEIVVEVVGGFIGYTEAEVLNYHNKSFECLKSCDDAVANCKIEYRSCAVAFSNDADRISNCGNETCPKCECGDIWSVGQSLKFPKNPGEPPVSFRQAAAPVFLFDNNIVPGNPPKLYFSLSKDVWVIPFNDKNTNNRRLENSESIPCNARQIQSLSGDDSWNSVKESFKKAIEDRSDANVKQWTDSNTLLLRFSLKVVDLEVEWEVLERKVMSFYVQPVNDAPRIITPSEPVLVSEDSLTPVPNLLLLDDGTNTDKVRVTFTLQRGFATSFSGIVASDDLKLEQVFSDLVEVGNLEGFIRKFRLVSPDNIGTGNFDFVNVQITETLPAGFGDAQTVFGGFSITYTAQTVPDIPAVFLSVPNSQISLTENARFNFDSLGLGHIQGTDSFGVRNSIPPTPVKLKISCRGPFGLLFLPQSLGRRMLDSHPAPLCANAGSSMVTSSSFLESQSDFRNGQFCRDLYISGSVEQIENQARAIVYVAFRYNFSLMEISGLVLSVIGSPQQHLSNANGTIVNENKIFLTVNVMFSSTASLGAKLSRAYTEQWTVLQKFSPPIPFAFEDSPAMFRSELFQFVSEASDQLYGVTISSRMNRIYIAAPYRDRITFEVGSGLIPEKCIVFKGSSKTVREALTHIMYVSEKNYNTEFDRTSKDEICIRKCFEYHPNSALAQESDCTQLCRDTVREYLNTRKRTNDLILDDLIVDFNDLGSGGLGISRFSVKLHSPLFIAAINDGPCLSFLGSVFVNCFDSTGNPKLSSPSFSFEMEEGTSESISLGEFLIEDYDMFEKGSLKCQNATAVAEARIKISDGTDLEKKEAKFFLSSCPVIQVAISAARGLIGINYRSNMEIYVGAVDQFTPIMKYFGSLDQVRQSLRNVRYKLAPDMSTFNHLSGIETITVRVDDGGFSGADPVGQFENVAASSTIQVPIKILPVNNPPVITLPSSSGGSFQLLENEIKPLRRMLPPGLSFSIKDVDSDECGGFVSVALSVNIGHLDVSFLKNQPIMSRIQNLFFAPPLTSLPPTPTYCNVMSFSAKNADVEEILSNIAYQSPPFVNSEVLDPKTPIVISVSASDRKISDGSFNCGRQLASSADPIRFSSEIFIRPVNSAPSVSFSLSALSNGDFESPSLCGGRQFYSVMDPSTHYWLSSDAFVSNGAVDTSIANTPAYYPGSEIGSDIDIAAIEGYQWVTIIRQGSIRQSFSKLLAPDGFYSIQLWISRPSFPAVATNCEIRIIHRNGSLVQSTVVSDASIQSESNWKQIKTRSFLGSSCGYTFNDTFDSNFSCQVVIQSLPTSRGDGWGFAVDDVVLVFDRFQSIEGARIDLRGFQASDPDINTFSLKSWAAANTFLQIEVSLAVAHGSLFFRISPAVVNISTLIKMFPQGCNSTACYEDACSSRFRATNTTAPNCLNKGVILSVDCTSSQLKSFVQECLSVTSINNTEYPANSKLTWNSLLNGAQPRPCPDGWMLLEDDAFLSQMQTKKACVNMGPIRMNGNFLSGAGVTVLTGSPSSINDLLSTLYYIPQKHFNSQSNRGSEALVVKVSDLGHSGRRNEPVLNVTQIFPIFIIAINNPPQIDTLIPKLIVNEDAGPIPITFLAFVDVDSEEPPGVVVSLKLQCGSCKFALNSGEGSLANQAVDIILGDYFIHLNGRLPAIQSMFQSRSVTYEPFHNYFGDDFIYSELNDRGGSGLGDFDEIGSYIRNSPASSMLSSKALVATRRLPVIINPVNDVSKLIIADEGTGSRQIIFQSGEVAILPLLRKQSTPQPFDFIAVEDVDSELGISISLTCQNGVWQSTHSGVQYLISDDGRIVSISKGNLTEINLWLKGLNFVADKQFLGSEDILISLSDNVVDPVTGAAPVNLKIIVPISVLPVIKCLFNDCKTCNEQKDTASACGWCPSACNGQGRCLEAQLNQDGPKFGICPPLPNDQSWMMCQPPEKDIVTPVVLGYFVTTTIAIGAIFFFYSYRTNYGSLRSSIRSKFRIVKSLARDFNILPHSDFQYVKLFIVACCGALAIVIPTILGIVPKSGFDEYLTGASRLTIKVSKTQYANNACISQHISPSHSLTTAIFCSRMKVLLAGQSFV